MRNNASDNGYICGIDGLRAIAVLAVMIYHSDFSTLPGGFTGVDVFFVISGYVISGSLSKTAGSGFSKYLFGFYKRRIIRIFPALLVCLVVTSIVTVLFVPDSWLSRLNSRTGLGAFFGLSNFVLVGFDDGYFDPRGEFNPFLHTWSLAVEEQFYALFPLVFYAWLRFRKNSSILGFWSRYSLAVLLIASLVYSYFETGARPDHAFYLLPSRFWEMATGALLLQLHSSNLARPQSAFSSNICSFLGVILLTVGFSFSSKNLFPFPWAVVPVCGTALLIAGVLDTVDRQSFIQSFLRSKLITYLGKISYSLYLWHWPVYALFRWTIGLDSVLNMAIAIIIIFSLSAASYHCVEFPVRTHKYLTGQYLFRPILVGLGAIFISYSFSKVLFNHQSRVSLSVTADAFIWYPHKYKSSSKPKINYNENLSGRSIFTVGDSHAGAYTTMLYETRHDLGVEVNIHTKAGCAVLNLLTPTSDKNSCNETVEATLSEIENKAKPGDIVFLASLRMNRLGDQWTIFSQNNVDARQRITADSKNRKLVEEEADKLIKELGRYGLNVVIDAPMPIFKSPPYRCSDWFNSMNPICSSGFSLSREFLEKHRRSVMETLTKLADQNSNLSIWDPFFVLCRNENCSAFDGTKPLFFDGDHLSGHGNRLLVHSFEAHVQKVWEKDKYAKNKKIAGRPG